MFADRSKSMVKITKHLEIGFVNRLKPRVSLTLSEPIPQNGQTHSNSSSAFADELFECVDHFVGFTLN